MVVLLITQTQSLQELITAMYREKESIKVLVVPSRTSVEEALEGSTPGLVVVDSLHPEATILVQSVRAAVPELEVLVLIRREEDKNLLAWTGSGVSGYLIAPRIRCTDTTQRLLALPCSP